MSNTQQPEFTAYAVTKRGEGQEDWWTPIGAAFPHGDGDGYNIILQTIPLDGKIVLRPPKEKKANDGEKQANEERTREAVRQENDRRRSRSR
jgi:hypothetical protein